jgi:cytochrome c nitrite reductase small subunit
MNFPSTVLLILGILLGVTLGIGTYTFLYAKGYSYMTNDPEACANCHVMNEQYDGWLKSSHRAVAVCNDCHTPSGFLPKYMTKAENGFRHSFAFTTGLFPEPIRITNHDREITNGACRKCHGDIVEAIEGPHPESQMLVCLDCHKSMGHLE